MEEMTTSNHTAEIPNTSKTELYEDLFFQNPDSPSNNVTVVGILVSVCTKRNNSCPSFGVIEERTVPSTSYSNITDIYN